MSQHTSLAAEALEMLPRFIETPDDLHHRLRLERRFVSYVQPSGECAVWTGAKAGKGYGVFFIAKRNRRTLQVYAHRAAWVLAYGPIPDGLFVCHHCDNPACVKPGHLFLGTQFDNMRDAARKGRTRNHARLTQSDADAIRDRYAAGGVTQRQIADQYGISFQHVSNIVRGNRWGITR